MPYLPPQQAIRQTGQTLAELSLVLALVSLGVIGGLFFLRDTITAAFVGMLGGYDFKSPAEQVASAGGLSGGGSGSSGSGGGVSGGGSSGSGQETAGDTGASAPTGNNPYIKLANGKILNLPKFEKDFVHSVETTGANGATSSLAYTLEDLAMQLKKEGMIDSQTANILRDLANKGHEIAGVQKAVEEGYRSFSSADEFNTMKMNYNGEQVMAWQLNDMIGYGGHGPGSVATEGFDSSNLSPTGKTKELIDIYRDLEASGAIGDPAVSAVVRDLVTRIAISSEVTEDASANVRDQNIAFTDFNARQESGATHYNSQNLCNIGDGSDSGVYCP